MTTLGKGLESLIPPKKQGGGSDVPMVPQNPAELGLPGGKAAPFVFKLGATHEENKEGPAAAVLGERLVPRGGNVSYGQSAPKDFDTGGSARDAAASRGDTSRGVRHASHQYQGENASIFQIEVEKIKSNPHQPRRTFDETEIKNLAVSIREFGMLQPIVVSKIEREVPYGTEVEYELIAGERRLMAAKLIGLPRVPAIVRHVDAERERLELAIIENLQRENLNPIEMARAFSKLQDEFRLTQREIASRLGKSREVVANTVRLLDLPLPIQEAVARGAITESHGRLLLGVTDPKEQQALFEDLIAQRFTTRELRARASLSLHKKREASPPTGLAPELKILEEELSAGLKAPVTIYKHGESGKITITFYSKEELEHIIDRLREDLGS